MSTVFIYVLLSIQQVMIPKKEEKEFIEGLRKRHIGISKTEDKFAIELRKRKVAFRRQVKMGIYRVDFYVPPSIVVEIEGLCHEDLGKQHGTGKGWHTWRAGFEGLQSSCVRRVQKPGRICWTYS